MKLILSMSLLALGLNAFAAKNSDPLVYVPGGQIVHQKNNNFDIKTPNGTIVEIELTGMGDLDEADGEVIEKDLFKPSNGDKTLSQIVKILKDAGYTLLGDWSYDNQFFGGHVYEVDAFKDGKEWEVTLDAKSGQIIKEKLD